MAEDIATCWIQLPIITWHFQKPKEEIFQLLKLLFILIYLTRQKCLCNFSEHWQLAKKVRSFLNLAEIVDNDYIDSSSSSDEDTADEEEFECIDKSELIDEMESKKTCEQTEFVKEVEDSDQ